MIYPFYFPCLQQKIQGKNCAFLSIKHKEKNTCRRVFLSLARTPIKPQKIHHAALVFYLSTQTVPPPHIKQKHLNFTPQVPPLFSNTQKTPPPFRTAVLCKSGKNYRYFFISSDAFAGSSETVKVRFMLLTSANLAAHARNSSQTLESASIGLFRERYRLST